MEGMIFSGPIASSMDGALPFIRTCSFKRKKPGILKTGVCIEGKGERRVSGKNFRVRSILESPSDRVKCFYKCINEKNSSQLGDFFSDCSVVKDCSFVQPFQGKKEIVGFFEQLFVSMGQNVTFNVGYVCEGDEFTAGASWHLEWKKVKIPFTRGCTFFEFSKHGERLAIEEAVVLIESPIKPGGLVLTLLKIVTSVFDYFPKTSEKFLQSPNLILRRILRIYGVFLAPLFNPVIKSYINLANYSAKLLVHAINILLRIAMIFFK